MGGIKEADQLKINLAFEYYKQQREEMMELGKERLSISLQLLIILGTLAALFFQASTSDLVKLVSGAKLKKSDEVQV